MNLEPLGKKQTLTKFLCQELLYEFITGNLNPEKQKAVDLYLTGCRESQQELERLKRGLTFTAQIAKVPVSKDLSQALMGFEPQWKKRLRVWTVWWSAHGWRLLPYAVIAAVVGLSIAVAKPWRWFGQREVILAEQTRTEPDLALPPSDVKVESAKVVSPLAPADEKEKPMAHAVLPAAVVPVPVNPVVAEPAAAIEAGGEAKSEVAVQAIKSIVIRSRITISDFAVIEPVIREKIVAFGGTVIGKRSLGSQLKPGEAYFHFSLPESNREEFETFLKTFSPVRFQPQADPLVMPEGRIHIILTVKDGGPNENPEAAETP